MFNVQQIMETQYYILFSLKTTDGWEPFAKFFIGNHKQEAEALFGLLKGSTHVDERHPLSIDFMETIKGLPVNLKMLNCNLSELGENARIITKELFRLHLQP